MTEFVGVYRPVQYVGKDDPPFGPVPDYSGPLYEFHRGPDLIQNVRPKDLTQILLVVSLVQRGFEVRAREAYDHYGNPLPKYIALFGPEDTRSLYNKFFSVNPESTVLLGLESGIGFEGIANVDDCDWDDETKQKVRAQLKHVRNDGEPTQGPLSIEKHKALIDKILDQVTQTK